MLLAFALASAAVVSPVSSAQGSDQVRATMWTVGTAAPARRSSEVCRWSVSRFTGAAVVTLAEGSVAGHCAQVRTAVEAAQSRALAAG